MPSHVVMLAALALAVGCGEPPREAPRPGLLDHGPHHGGVVMAGPRMVVEARAWPDGSVRVWLTDGWRRPIPLDGVRGTARLSTRDGTRAVALEPADAALEGRAGALAGASVPADIEVIRQGGEAWHVPAVLPLIAGAAGAAGIPLDGCVAPPADGADPAPRCVLRFLQGLAVVAATPAGDAMVVGVLESPTTAWRLPEVALLAGFAAPPPESIAATEAPHAEEPTAMAVSPDGREAVLAMGAHLLRHEIASGRVVAALPAPDGAVRSVAWASSGRLLSTRFGGREVLVVDPRDGAVARRLPVDGDVTVVAAARDGRLAAVGTEAGAIFVLDVEGAGAARRLDGPVLPVDALGVADGRIVSAGGDGVLRVWDAASGALTASVPVGGAVMRLAIAADGRRVATADREARLRIHALPSGEIQQTIGWHRGQVRTLAWAGALLLAGDADRQLALWPLPGGPDAR